MPYNLESYLESPASVMEFDNWYDYRVLFAALSNAIRTGTQTLAQREVILAAIEGARRTQLYGVDKRFPEPGTYVCFGHGAWKVLSAKILTGLQSRARYHDDRGATQNGGASDNGSETHFRSLQDSARSLDANLHSALEHLRGRFELFTRVRFESRYGLTWA